MDAVLWTLNLPTSLIMFLSMYLLAYFVIFRNWTSKLRAKVSSCFISLVHGTPAVIFAVQALLHSQNSHSYASPNSDLHNRVFEFSMAYFLMGLFHYIVFFPTDILFILHHLATLYVIVTCRYMVHYGAYGILVLLTLAEITSLCQNMWTIARFRRADVSVAARLYVSLSPPFLVFYSVVRGILGPLFVFKMVMFHLSEEASLVPGWAWISWMVVIVTGILVSILWVSNHWIEWLRERSHLARKKIR